MTQEILLEIERLAGLLFAPHNIALVIEMETEAFMDELLDENSPIFRHYWKGKLKTEAELRKSVIDLAKQGSGPAQSIALRLLDEMNQQDRG